MSEYFVGSTGANNQTNFSSLSTSEVLDDLGLNTGDSPTFSGLFLEGSGSTIFSVDGSNGRLFGVTDEVTGTVFSVNDAAGLPIIEVESTSSYDKITLGEYGSDLLVLSGQSTIEITGSQIASQSWVGQQGFITSETDDQNLNEVLAEGNTSSYGISVNQITGTALTIDTDTLFVDSTNDRVGIGTTTPNVPLEVHGADITSSSNTTAASVLRLVRDITDSSYTLRKDSAVDFMLSRQQATANNFPYTRLDIRLAGTTDSSTPSLDVMSLLYDGKVGIGTTSPNELLHVEDSSTSSGTSIAIQNAFGESPKNIKFRFNDTVETARIEGFGRNNPSQLPYLAFHVNQTTSSLASNDVAERMRIDSSGNVGIGTTSPSDELEVYKNGSDVAIRIHEDAGTHEARLHLRRGGNDWEIINNSDLAFEIEGSEIARFKTNGNVGIGTTSPNVRLELRREDSGDLFELNRPASGVSALYGGVSSNDPYLYSNNGIFSLGVNNPNGGLGGEVAYITMRNGSTRYTTFEAGNVGIGTTSPAEKLTIQQVSDGSGVKILGFDDESSESLHLSIQSSGNSRLNATRSINIYSGDSFGGGIGSATTGLTWDAFNQFKFTAETSARIPLSIEGAGSQTGNLFNITSNGGNDGDLLTVTSSGEVGIGTNGPATKLDVYKATSTSASSTGTPLLRLHNYVGSDLSQQKTFIDFTLTDDNGNETPQVRIGAEVGQNGDANSQVKEGSGAFVVYTNNADTISGGAGASLAERMRVDYQGKVGIGETAPEVKLEVAGDIMAKDSFVSAGATASQGYTFHDFGTGWGYKGVQSPSRLAMFTDSAERVTIDSNGNVGIGTTAPQEKFHIHNSTGNSATIRLSDPDSTSTADATGYVEVYHGENTSRAGYFGLITNSEMALATTTSAGKIRLYTGNNTTALTIDSSQNATFAGAITANGNIVTTSASQIIASRKFSALNTSGVMLTDSGASNGLSIANGGNATFTHDLTVSGDLTVNGTTTTINSTTVQVDDKNIELGTVATPTDTTADGGGITLKGATDKTINWVNSTDAWTFSERVSIPDGSASAPALTFSGDSDTGMYRFVSGSDAYVGFATGGSFRGQFGPAGISSNANVYTGNGSDFRNYGGTWKGTTGLTGNGFQFINSVDGTALTISSTGDTVASGTVKASSYFLGSSTEISLATTGAGSVFLRPNGQSTSGQMQLESTGNATFAGKITSGNDIVNATAGVYTWVGDTDTYIQRSAANEITIKTGASNALVLDSSQNATFAGNITTNGDITIDNSSGDPFLKLKTSSQEYVVRIDQSDSEKFQIRNTTSSVTALSIDASSNATFAGSVTATGLDINGTADISGSLTLSGGSLIGDSNWDIFAEYTNRGRINLLSANATDTTTQIALMTNGNNRLTIDKAGTSTFAGDIIVDTPTGNSQTSHTLKLKKTNSGGSVQVGAEITSSPYATNTNGGNLVFKTANTSVSPTTALTLDGAQNATFAGDVTVNKLKMGNTQLYPSGDSNHIHFIGTALIGTSTTASSNPKIGTSAYPFSQVHAGYFYGDGSNLTNLPSAADNTKLPLAGGTLTGNVRFNDTIKAEFGSGADLQINHDGTQSLIDNGTGNLTIQNQTNDGDIIFKSDDGSGGITEYLRLDGGQVKTIFSKTTIHNDGVEAQFGNGADLKIYHTGANSYIDDIGTGSLYIRGANDVNIRSYNGGAGEQMIKAIANGAVELYHDNIKKFETTSTGVDITGHLSATTKSFLVDNPKTGGKLQYGVVESDQHSVLVRGKNDTETIELPEEWEWLVDEDSVTVDLTSIGQIQQLFVVSQDNKTIKIGGLATNGKYNYTVYGERKDVKKLEVNI